MDGPPEEVLDLFAVPDTVAALPGGRGRSVRAGDLVLSPGRDPDVLVWLNPLLARLAVRLDEQPGRSARDLRIAVPVPARDGSWAVAGWAASRYEPGTTVCHDAEVVRATARILHAELASVVPARPPQLAFGSDDDRAAAVDGGPVAELVGRLRGSLASVELGPAQLVHADLADNVLLDAAGAPVVIDVAPAWRPARWAEALCVLDSVVAHDAPLATMTGWAAGADRQAMLRAALFRVLSDQPCPVAAYERALAAVI